MSGREARRKTDNQNNGVRNRHPLRTLRQQNHEQRSGTRQGHQGRADRRPDQRGDSHLRRLEELG